MPVHLLAVVDLVHVWGTLSISWCKTAFAYFLVYVGNAWGVPPPISAKDGWLVGVVVSMVLITDEELSGEVYAYDPITTCIVIRM